MPQHKRQDAALNLLRIIPTRWALVIVALAITYVVLQPRLNQWFGWSLPSVGAMLGDESAKPKEPKRDEEKARTSKNTSQPDKHSGQSKSQDTKDKAGKSTKSLAEDLEDSLNVNGGPIDKDSASVPAGTKKSSEPNPKNKQLDTSEGAQRNNRDEFDPTYGVLKSIGESRLESPAGLVYGRGSEEGTRLAHIERHLHDQPSRPGSHGVYRGSMKDFLLDIDDAYTRAKRGDKGTSKRTEDNSTVYEAGFEKSIGFLGGVDGARKKNPSLKRMRVVVRGNNLITAFPVQ